MRTAVHAVRNHLQHIMDLLVEPGQQIKGLRLEETELSEDKQHWLITLGFDIPVDAHRDPLGLIEVKPKYEREYRVFKVDAQTGEVQAIKENNICWSMFSVKFFKYK